MRERKQKDMIALVLNKIMKRFHNFHFRTTGFVDKKESNMLNDD